MTIDLDAIEARANAATPGPWTSEYHHEWFLDRGGLFDGIPFDAFANDAEFCAAARTDVPELVARVRLLEAENAALKAATGFASGLAHKFDNQAGALRERLAEAERLLGKMMTDEPIGKDVSAFLRGAK